LNSSREPEFRSIGVFLP